MSDVEYFDRWARTYENSWLQGFLFDRVHKAVVDYTTDIAEPTSVLDIACGTGRLLRAVGARWPQAQLLGVDAANGMIEVARQLTPRATFYVNVAEALPFPDASVDLLLSTLSFHHWHDQKAGLREVARVLCPAGRFILADAYTPSWLSWLTRHPIYTGPTQLQTLFTDAGMNVVFQKSILSRYVLMTVGTS